MRLGDAMPGLGAYVSLTSFLDTCGSRLPQKSTLGGSGVTADLGIASLWRCLSGGGRLVGLSLWFVATNTSCGEARLRLGSSSDRSDNADTRDIALGAAALCPERD